MELLFLTFSLACVSPLLCYFCFTPPSTFTDLEADLVSVSSTITIAITTPGTHSFTSIAGATSHLLEGSLPFTMKLEAILVNISRTMVITTF